jgi:Arc/MetJ-type ribon-helix-helix transcriptional regulator
MKGGGVMESMQITLTPELSEFVEQQVAVGGFQGPHDYILALVEEKRTEVAREELERLLEDGVNSPSRPFTPAVMDEIRRRMHERIEQLRGT